MNKNNAHLFKPFVDALMAGKDVTFLGRSQDEFGFAGEPEDYAIVEPPTPAPLTYEDVEPGCHLRFPGLAGLGPNRDYVSAITHYERKAVTVGNHYTYKYTEIMHAEIYRPSTRTWSPAHK